MRKGGGGREEKEEREKREKEEKKRIRRWRGGKMCNEEGGGGWRSAAGSCRRRCAVPLLPGSARLGSSRLGSAPGCPEGAGTDPSRLGEGCGAVPIPFQPQEGLGLSHSFSSSGRIWGCPDPHPNPGVAGAAPTPHTHLLTAPLSCAGPCAPTFGGGGEERGWRRGVQPPMDTKGFGRCHHFCWAKSSWRRAPSPPPGFVPLRMKLFPPLQTSARADWHFFSPILCCFFFPALISHLSFSFSFFFPKGFFPIGIPSPRSSSGFCRGRFWMLA